MTIFLDIACSKDRFILMPETLGIEFGLFVYGKGAATVNASFVFLF